MVVILQNPLVLSPSTIPNPTRPPPSPIFRRTHLVTLCNPKPFLRGSLFVARFGFNPGLLPDPDGSGAENLISDLFGRAESLLYTIADAAVSNSDTVTSKQNGDWLSGITYGMETVLKILKDGLSTLHTPYAYGFAIILLTVLVKAATFPLTKKQVESAMAMRSLQPQVKAIQERYAGDQERIQLEIARLYKLAAINPLAGCLPTLATIPVWIGLYRALSNVANEGLLTEGFFWIPSLAGPTTIASRQNGSGISWLFPFMDGHPPLGWSDTLAYLVLPVLLVVLQYISMQIMQSSQSNDPSVKNSQAITKFLPLMIGYFSLSVPSGLSLYWFTNNILSTLQQVWLQKLGGARNPARQFNDDIFKEDQLNNGKYVPDLNSTKPKSAQVQESTPEGPHAGERFKQIKEQEARRRQQREEEARKAEVAAVKGSSIANEGLEKETNSFEKGANPAHVVEGNSLTSIHDSSTGVVINGGSAAQDLKKDDVFGVERSEVSDNGKVSAIDEQISNENEGKEAAEIYGSTATTEGKLSEEGKREVKRE
uniref:Membrane insertase YidC/Oxa/ALB C-terminal domain-containing protein n=2 Tax=Rhizophora mucronata TaxID=61149 RepID=A0A2P2JAD5_RHIMU